MCDNDVSFVYERDLEFSQQATSSSLVMMTWDTTNTAITH